TQKRIDAVFTGDHAQYRFADRQAHGRHHTDADDVAKPQTVNARRQPLMNDHWPDGERHQAQDEPGDGSAECALALTAMIALPSEYHGNTERLHAAAGSSPDQA
nr:hypothetical protein [Tanacetum cinerariifolium]